MKKLRLAFAIVIIVSLIQGWWYVILPLGLIGAWAWPLYAELIVAGIIYDSLYGAGMNGGFRGYAGTIISVVVILAAVALKKFVRR